MKQNLALALLLSSSFALPAFAAPSSCISDLSPAAKYAIAYLSYLERGGTNYAQPADRAGRTPDEICAELRGVVLERSRTRPGYTQVSLWLAEETCSMDVVVGSDERVTRSAEMRCEAHSR